MEIWDCISKVSFNDLKISIVHVETCSSHLEWWGVGIVHCKEFKVDESGRQYLVTKLLLVN